jgi:Tfp pilus assembly pilus retraction ATPase PilT
MVNCRLVPLFCFSPDHCESNSFAVRASLPGLPAMITGGDLDEKQMRAVATLAGKHRLVVVEGAAGAGKTATLAGTRTVIAQTGIRK